MREQGTIEPDERAIDPSNVLAINLAQLAASCSDEDAFRVAVQRVAYERDPELIELGDDPDRFVSTRCRERITAELGRAIRRRNSAALPPPPSRCERLWLAVQQQRDAAWKPVADELTRKRVIAQRVSRCGAALRSRDLRLLREEEPWRDEGALPIVRSWDEALRDRDADAARVLVLLGDPGLGKTLSAVWWITSARPRVEGRYVRMRDLSSCWTADFGRPDATFERLLSSQLLVVDELGWERTAAAKARGAEVLLELLERRGCPPFATVLVSNRPKRKPEAAAGFLDHYAGVGLPTENAPLLDRLRSDAEFIELGGESLRPGEL